MSASSSDKKFLVPSISPWVVKHKSSFRAPQRIGINIPYYQLVSWILNDMYPKDFVHDGGFSDKAVTAKAINNIRECLLSATPSAFVPDNKELTGTLTLSIPSDIYLEHDRFFGSSLYDITSLVQLSRDFAAERWDKVHLLKDSIPKE